MKAVLSYCGINGIEQTCYDTLEEAKQEMKKQYDACVYALDEPFDDEHSFCENKAAKLIFANGQTCYWSIIEVPSNSDKIEIKVKDGYLKATTSEDPNFPGIDIEYIPEEIDELSISDPRILIEKPVDSNELRALIWNDSQDEDYTDKIVFNCYPIEKRSILGQPRFKKGDYVSFTVNNEVVTGVIEIIDEYGTFFDSDHVCYDIFNKKANLLYKHVREEVITLVEN